jgi:tetratricopeptide (TPR) repeat protein/transcriptional regulator with XRE-family HTH domain
MSMNRVLGDLSRGAVLFGQLVVANRQRMGLTQEELAGRTGLSVRAIRDLESGRVRVPRQASVRLLADAFGLLGEEREHFHCQAGKATPVPAPTRREANGPVPAQLPADVAAFTGRGSELAQLEALLAGTAPGRPEPAPVVISTVSGTAGVGKTALALRWAHGARDRYPDGQLYVNLRGYDQEQPITPGDALARFLGALGVAGADIPVEVDDRAARYRTMTAGRRMLIVLDNAATVEQVRPLLPGTPSCAVVVTSRHRLAGLVAVHGAHRLDLDLLPLSDAVALLHRLIGARVEAEPVATAALARQCARLPLALRVAAELAISRPSTPLAELVVELGDQQRRLHLLDPGDDPRAAVPAVFSWSLRHLPPAVARAFRLLGLHPAADVDIHAVAALADVRLDEAVRLVDLLAQAHLVEQTRTGRYGMHDLLRAYAGSRAAAEETEVERRAAVGRLFDYYVGTAAAAMDSLFAAEAHHRPRVDPPTTPVPDLTDPDGARDWLDAERSTLVAVSAHAAAHGWADHAIRLSTMLFRYLNGGHHVDGLAIHSHARDAAERSGDRVGLAHALIGIGSVQLRLGDFEPATEHLQAALAMFGGADDGYGEARALTSLGIIEQRRGNFPTALEYHGRVLAWARRAGDLIGEARATTSLGVIEHEFDRLEPAAEHLGRAVALCEQVGDGEGEAYARVQLGDVERRLGRLDSAVRHQEHALTHYRRSGSLAGQAWSLVGLGDAKVSLGRPDEAGDHLEGALTLFRRIGERNGEIWVLNALGEAARGADRPGDALAHHLAALTVAADLGVADQQARAHAGLGHAHACLGDPLRARHHYEQALAGYAALSDPEIERVRAELADLDGPGSDQSPGRP